MKGLPYLRMWFLQHFVKAAMVAGIGNKKVSTHFYRLKVRLLLLIGLKKSECLSSPLESDAMLF